MITEQSYDLTYLYYFLVLVGVAVAAFVLFSIFRKIAAVRAERIEARTGAMVDSMTMRRQTINTQFMEGELNTAVQSLVYSHYCQQPQAIPAQSCMPQFYASWYENMKREYELGVRRKINEFIMESAKVVKQEASSMYAVTHIEVEGVFHVDFEYYHPTMHKRTQRSFKQKFVFLNNNNAWLIEKAHPEEAVGENSIDLNI